MMNRNMKTSFYWYNEHHRSELNNAMLHSSVLVQLIVTVCENQTYEVPITASINQLSMLRKF
jgi:hypothetical protein